MRWLFRIALTIGFLGLAALAIMPYLPRIQKEAGHFYDAWKEIRTEQIKPETETSTAKPSEKTIERRRPLSIPKSDSVDGTETDLFLSEARRRAQDDPESAMAWLQNQDNSPQRLRGMLEVVALWAADDSEGALLWLESNAQGIARLETLNSAVELWSAQDPVAASEWIAGMANDGSKVTATKALVENWAKTQPEEASAWVSALPYGPLRDEAAQALIESWTKIDPEKAAIWALSEAEFYGNSDLLYNSIEQFTKVDPKNAELFLRNLTEAYDAPETIDTYVRALAQTDPIEAMLWQSGLTSEDPLSKEGNTRIIMQEWSRTDSVAASAWLSDQVPGTERDAAILGFNDTILQYEPEAATAWANYISDPKQREQLLRSSIQKWAYAQPQEALKWVKEAELDPALRTSLASEIGAD